MAALRSLLSPWHSAPAGTLRALCLRTWLAGILLGLCVVTATANERHSDPDGCFSCHGLPDLEYVDTQGVRRVATILKSDYYSSLHGSVPCKDCHRKIERYPHKPEEGYVDCSESCHVNEPSKGKPFSHKDVVAEFKQSAHGSGHAPGATKDFHGGNRLTEENDQQNPSCRRCHSNTPYISDTHMGRFKEEFQHTETECGTCHQGQTWMNQFSGHILRRLVGKNFNKMEANRMCVDCHGNQALMDKVKLQDPQTKAKEPAPFRWKHATDSYAKTLHGRFLAVNDESGAGCIDCHAPGGFRHGIQRDESLVASTHPTHLEETCGQAGCHGYAKFLANLGFTRTDLHDADFLKMISLGFVLDPSRWDSSWYRAMWISVPLVALFGIASLLWSMRGGNGFGSVIPVIGGEHFLRVMIGVRPKQEPDWFSRLSARFGVGRMPTADPVPAAAQLDAPRLAADAEPTMTILYASQTGNGEGIAHDLAAYAQGYAVNVLDMADYEPAQILTERLLFIICSTHGEGEPPIPAERLHAYLYSEDAPRLEGLKFGVLALGDSSYRHFCKAGKDFDAFLMRLGATRILERVDADADFEEVASNWIRKVVDTYRTAYGITGPLPSASATPNHASEGEKSTYGKTNPYPARVLKNINLNGTGSAKETRHLEIDLGDSGLVYEPGDALGIYPKNNPAYVEALLAALGQNGYTEVNLGKETVTLREALFSRLDATGLSRVLIEKYAELIDSRALRELLSDERSSDFDAYTWGRHILDLVLDYPLGQVPVQAFADALRRMAPRLYSIASSLKAHPGQVHLTVGAVRYHAHGLDREGVCSTHLAGRLDIADKLNVFVQQNKAFRLPQDPSAPVVMVGPGTGIAPFRSFVEEREVTGATGKNWLFFGDQKRATDYLYAEEWEDKLRRGVLNRLDLAFSRDQDAKIYVQTRILENARDLYAWLEDGAYFYVCGDASRMANDVNEALLAVIQQEGAKTRDQAQEYLHAMAHAKRYQRDVY